MPTGPGHTGVELYISAQVAAARGGKPREIKRGAANAAGVPKPGSSFYEASKEVTHDNELYAGIARNAAEHTVDGRCGSGVLQRIHQQYGAKNDGQRFKSAKKTGYCPGSGFVNAHLPKYHADYAGQEPGKGQRPLCGPVEAYHQHNCYKNWYCGK